MAVFGSLIWLFTRSNWWLRVGFLGLLFAMRLSANSDGWIKLIWNSSPIDWIFQFDYLKYLFIVIPGTVAGDLLHRWIEYSEPQESTYARWHSLRYSTIMILMLF